MYYRQDADLLFLQSAFAAAPYVFHWLLDPPVVCRKPGDEHSFPVLLQAVVAFPECPEYQAPVEDWQ